jgi:myo-inositol-1(or 4)-monophosphatase
MSPTPSQDLERRHAVAVEVARAAGALLLTKLGRVEAESKGEVEFVTEADRASEALILGRIRAAFPDDAVFSEEAGESDGRRFRWIVDPLDGTTNFVHGNPLFVVSIGLEHEGELVSGVVYHPWADELFEAPPGGGALSNGRPLRVSTAPDASKALFVTGFPYYRRRVVDALLDRVRRALLTGHALRRTGSAALDLAWLACGRVDAYWEEGLFPYDVAAGVLLVRRAGGRVTTYAGDEYRLSDGTLIATNGRMHAQVVALMAAAPSVPPPM